MITPQFVLDINEEIIIDNFAGGGGASTGIELALGRHVDVAINHDPEAVSMHQANHPQTKHHCESVWEVNPREVEPGRPIGLLWLSPDCFPAGSMVLTRDGYLAIEQLQVGDQVLTHLGRWRAVTEVSSTVKPLLRLRGHGHPGLVVSHEHPFFARQRTDVWNNTRRSYDRTLTDAQWTPASMLDNGWYWSTPVEFPSAEIPAVSVYRGRETALSPALMWVVGRYVADGWTRLTDTRAELVITCGLHEVNGLREHLSAWPRVGSRSGSDEMTWHERETGTAYQFTVSHRGFVEWLRANFGHGAADKLIPGWALGMDKVFRLELLEGYLSGDGWKGQHKGEIVECRTVSKALAFGIKALASSLGKSVAIYTGENTNVIEGRTVNALPYWQLRWRSNPVDGHRQTFREGNLEWAPIRSQEEAGESEVFNIGVEEDESYVVDGIVVHNCKHHSKAKGGKPVEKNIRGLAWVALRWAAVRKPRVIMLENVEEFQQWGPLVKDGNGDLRPCKKRKGREFNAFVNALRRHGYQVEWKELRACDYGAPTIRKRLFLIARRDGQPIVWPAQTHGDPKSEAVKAGKLIKWRTAAECMDWSIPCPSIFERKKPLAEATLRRIAKGIMHYVVNAAEPFIVPLTHHGADRRTGMEQPLPTVTAAHRGELALVQPFISTYYGDKRPGDVRGIAMDEPLHTQTTENRHALVAAFLTEHANASSPRSMDVGAPLRTQCAQVKGGHFALATGNLVKHYTGVVGSDLRDPIGTVTSIDHHSLVTSNLIKMRGDNIGQPDTEPLHTVSAQGTHFAEVRAFLIKYYGNEREGIEIDGQLHTVTARDRFGIVTVEGEEYAINDIGLRMLAPRELFRAQGFPDEYIIGDNAAQGLVLTKTAQVRMVGNSVCPPLAASLVRANLADMTSIKEVKRRKA